MSPKRIKYYLKNFNNSCCIKWLNHCFSQEKIKNIQFFQGGVSFLEQDKESVKNLLKKEGFFILEDKNLIKVEKIKQAVFELVFLQNNQNSIIQKSEYLIEKLKMPYPNISRLFSRYENITLEKYIIKTKIKKIKDLLLYEDYTLSEIAYIMDYSSVQHLSNQFKKETGYSVTEFKKIDINKVV